MYEQPQPAAEEEAQGEVDRAGEGLHFFVPPGFPWKNTRSRVRLKLFDPEVDEHEPVAVSATSTPAASMDEHLEAKLDAILEKIAKTGKESLTEKEQEILQQAAEMYKRRRS